MPYRPHGVQQQQAQSQVSWSGTRRAAQRHPRRMSGKRNCHAGLQAAAVARLRPWHRLDGVARVAPGDPPAMPGDETYAARPQSGPSSLSAAATLPRPTGPVSHPASWVSCRWGLQGIPTTTAMQIPVPCSMAGIRARLLLDRNLQESPEVARWPNNGAKAAQPATQLHACIAARPRGRGRTRLRDLTPAPCRPRPRPENL